MTAPGGAVPDGAYVGTAGQSNSITDLNNLTEDEAKRRMQSQIAPSFTSQRDGIWGFFGLLQNVISGAINLVVGAVQGIISLIGSLFSAGRADTIEVDNARVAAENAIVEQMSASTEKLDEIQRFGGTFMDYPLFSLDYGEVRAHIIPVNASVPLSRGAVPVGPYYPLTHVDGRVYPGFFPADREAYRSTLARGTGYLELTESGLWVIDFQAAVLQGSTHTDKPADVWCMVTSAATPGNARLVPASAPGFDEDWATIGNRQAVRDRSTGTYSEITTPGFVAAYGRGKSYVGVQDTQFGGGVTIGGRMYVYLQSPGWKVTMAGTGYRRFSGASSTFIYATKVNSETLRDEIDDLKDQFATALPGNSTALSLTEDDITAMVAQAGDIEVVIPDE